jgi:hypothetical protein
MAATARTQVVVAQPLVPSIDPRGIFAVSWFAGAPSVATQPDGQPPAVVLSDDSVASISGALGDADGHEHSPPVPTRDSVTGWRREGGGAIRSGRGPPRGVHAKLFTPVTTDTLPTVLLQIG